MVQQQKHMVHKNQRETTTTKQLNVTGVEVHTRAINARKKGYSVGLAKPKDIWLGFASSLSSRKLIQITRNAPPSKSYAALQRTKVQRYRKIKQI